MMVNKKQRFREVAEFDHVLEYTDFQQSDNEKPAGKWNANIFENENPLILELACGTGSYTIELARRNQERNYIGIDIKGARIWKGAKKAQAEGLDNVRFIRMFIDHLDEYFTEGEVDEIWITFADPFSRAGDRNNRLTHSKFLTLYKKVLKPGGVIHFKTDDTDFYNYSCWSIEQFGGSVIKKNDDIYSIEPDDDRLLIQTVFEKKHIQQGKTISYCKFKIS